MGSNGTRGHAKFFEGHLAKRLLGHNPDCRHHPPCAASVLRRALPHHTPLRLGQWWLHGARARAHVGAQRRERDGQGTWRVGWRQRRGQCVPACGRVKRHPLTARARGLSAPVVACGPWRPPPLRRKRFLHAVCQRHRGLVHVSPHRLSLRGVLYRK
jgi:hypothetical protein